MDQSQAIETIKKALFKTLDRDQEFTLETHLRDEQIVDSLDTALFLLEVEKLTGKKLPEKEVVDRGLMKVGNLVQFLTTN